MSDKEYIKLPEFGSFFEAKVNGFASRKARYSGSYGCDLTLGSLNSTTFNFYVEVKKIEDVECFIGTHYIQNPWYKNPLKEIEVSASFPNTPEGLQQCEDWLNNEVEEYIKG
ncbi:MAG: hypothetical protein HUJ56_12545 [Erysipelotrichaceae bacterium]|nr:hypothetical protein [Erysipelotrichaceae bacterium]